jgi:hypothetical protein
MIKPTKHTNSSKNVTIFMVVSSVGKFFIIGIKNQQVSITYMDFWLTILKKTKNQVWPKTNFLIKIK